MLLTRNICGEYYKYMHQQRWNENRPVFEVQSKWLKAFWFFLEQNGKKMSTAEQLNFIV